MATKNRVISAQKADSLINAWVQQVDKPFNQAEKAFFDESGAGCTGVYLSANEYINLVSCIGATHLCIRFGYDKENAGIKYCCIAYCVNSKGGVISPYYLIGDYLTLSQSNNNGGGGDGAVPNQLAGKWKDDWGDLLKKDFSDEVNKRKKYAKFFHVPGIEGVGKSSVLRGFTYSIAEGVDILFSNQSSIDRVEILNTCHCSLNEGEANFGIMFRSVNTELVSNDDDGNGYYDLGSPCPSTCP